MIVRGRKVRRGQILLPAIVPTVAQRQMLQTVYMRLVRQWGRTAFERIMPAYERALAEAIGVRDSTTDDVTRETDEAEKVLRRLALSLNATLETWVVRVEEWHRGRFAQAFTPSGVNVGTLLGQGDVQTTLRAALAENVGLVRSVDDQLRNGISGSVLRGLTNRTPAADVAREIRKLTGVARNRAELIASDQLQKLTSRLDQERQEQVGISKFKWRHSRKKNARPEHVARDGKTYRWDSAVAKTDPPGRAVRCGCRAQGLVDLDEIMDE